MFYIAICEDETSQLAVIEDKVRMYLKKNHILAELEAYGRGDLLKYDLQEGKYFDIILSDIEMPGT
ncbi:MAG: DNA-binding response regulator, partial [Lachnospiraceae bacterium]|nr:DNA-binding response regulator [Lachnospiraceae bacterium]